MQHTRLIYIDEEGQFVATDLLDTQSHITDWVMGHGGLQLEYVAIYILCLLIVLIRWCILYCIPFPSTRAAPDVDSTLDVASVRSALATDVFSLGICNEEKYWIAPRAFSTWESDNPCRGAAILAPST